ncbi:MAG: tetratricopeptide repeat protein, partial [Mariprofundaceae bacterium]|nr:tetratricopeptide repeat protein [Mariprofundaceae bacterium]
MCSLPIAAHADTGTQANADASDALSRGIYEYQDESYEEAVSTLEHARSTSPNDASLLYYLGLSYKATLQFAKAREFLQAARKESDEFEELDFNLGEILYNLGQYDLAEASLRSSVAKGVEPGRAAYFIGLIQYKAGHYAEAIDFFSRAVDASPELHKKALYSKALAQNRMGDRSAASESFQQVIAIAPDSYEAVQARDALADNTASDAQFSAIASLAYIVDTNVVLKPSSDSAGILVSRARDSATAVSMNLNYARQVDNDWGYSTSYGIYQDMHRYLNFFDVQSHHVDFTPYMKLGNGNAFMRVSADALGVDYRRYLLSFGAMGGYIMDFDGHQQGMLQAGYLRKIFFQPPSSAAENQDGHNYHAGYTHSWMSGQTLGLLEHLLASDGSQLDVSYAMDIENTRGSNWSYIGHHFKSILNKPVQRNLWFTLSGDYYRQVYRGKHTAFGIARKDRTIVLSPALEWRGGWMGSTFSL